MNAEAIRQAVRRQGGELLVRDGVLRYRGPRDGLGDSLRVAIRELKDELKAGFEAEVARRLEAMRPQLPAEGRIPLLVARRGMPQRLGVCCSCGDPPGPGRGTVCGPCTAARNRAIDEIRGPAGAMEEVTY